MSNRRRPIPLYLNPPPDSSLEHASDSEGYYSDFPPIRIRGSPAPEPSPYPLTQLRLEPRNDSRELENKRPSQTSPKDQAKRLHKPKSGLRARNVLNTTAEHDVFRKQSSKPSTSKRKALNDSDDDERPSKKSCLTFIDEDDLVWLKGKIKGMNDSIQRVADKVGEDQRNVEDKLDRIFDEIHRSSNSSGQSGHSMP